ncbi:SprT-like domain-containing protein [Rhodobium gokarnense]|uniref:SprT-like domain-containing protein n=1 Tax=Rhodobium gokarnense TaxID=364296 RepID=A0ABT3HEN9_9HYPH|nr:SprT-like domain-containing protein [Rhodobium gokarnense]MCW2308840.1 hypothetical protein [Rhodobium gokarnense]
MVGYLQAVSVLGSPGVELSNTWLTMAHDIKTKLLSPNDAKRIVRSNSRSSEEASKRHLPPTLEASAEVYYAYSYFNDALFGGKLPDVLISYTRQKNVLGHFYPKRFERSDGTLCHEVALNPLFLGLRPLRDSLSTLVHEQCHVWRHDFGPLNRRGRRGSNGYHDQVWAEKMESIGLSPSGTGLPGGKKTGHRMSHVIVNGGPFDIACRALLDTGFQINWHDRVNLTGLHAGGDDDVDHPNPQKKDRIKFTCPECGLNAWAKPSALLKCADCERLMLAAGSSLPIAR